MKRSKAANLTLWSLQVLLASLFLFAGLVKLGMPADELPRQTGLPAPFMQFMSVAEVAGGLGLLLAGWYGSIGSSRPLPRRTWSSSRRAP